jgi:biopolymer transport protein ExbD
VNFQRGKNREDPEINLIPMIDVLLVILIFLMITTTYSRFAELRIKLPEAAAQKSTEAPSAIDVAVDAAGHYFINHNRVSFIKIEELSEQLKRAAGSEKDPVLVIAADANATHQSVINILEAARMAGYTRITFTTQTQPDH